MQELTINLHMHTIYSDGSGTHAELGQAALKTGVDVLIVTDHNILVEGVNDYFRDGKKKVLVLACEEVHDQARVPQKNHLLVFGANIELSPLANNPQSLIDAVHHAGGICFIAHPVDPAMPDFGETDISWVDWGVTGYTGIELWNGFSELKICSKGKMGCSCCMHISRNLSLTAHFQKHYSDGTSSLQRGSEWLLWAVQMPMRNINHWDRCIKSSSLMSIIFQQLIPTS